MTHFRIYDGKVGNKATKAFFGEASNVRDYDNLKYPDMLQYVKDFFAEYWIEDEIKLGKDIDEFRNKLNERERYVYATITGMLNTLDSIATDFNFVLGMATTDPSLRSAIAMIDSFEVLHNRSYQYLTSTMLNQQEKEIAFEEVKNIKVLTKRNEYILTPIAQMIKVVKLWLCREELLKVGIEPPSKDEMLQALFEGILAYTNLEGLFFSGGFTYFHSLARDQKMIGSNDMINAIKTDENQHNEFYGAVLQIIMAENPSLNTKENLDYASNFMKNAVELEKEWAKFIFDDITTLSLNEYFNYVEYLSNLICRNAGLPEVFPDNKVLKSRWISTYGSKKRQGGDNEIVTRQDFLQGNTINYQHSAEEDFDL